MLELNLDLVKLCYPNPSCHQNKNITALFTKRNNYLKLLASGFQNNELVCFNKVRGETLAATHWISKQILAEGLLKFKIRILTIF